jgi:argonaute-like protein implicated in RNA metabolism and viral defense
MFSGDLINVTSSSLNQVNGTNCILYVNIKGEPQEYYQIMTWGVGEIAERIIEIMLN